METKKIIKLGWVAVGVLSAVVVGISSYTRVGSGEIKRIQNNIAGSYEWVNKEGYYLKAPFVSTVVRYPQEITIAVSDNEEICESASVCVAPRQVNFADTYGITIESSFRFSLPKTPKELEVMHDKVRNKENLVGTVLAPFSQDLINYTSTQFQAESFMQGGQNEFKSRMIDQATNGMLVTKREKVLIETESADRDSDRDSGSSKVGEQFKYVVNIIEDAAGNPRRNPTALEAYNINIVPAGINLIDYNPEPRLKDFMADKQDRVRARAKIVEDQENERQQAITSQLRGDRERIEKQNILLQQKDAAKIAGEKAVLEAELQAKRQVVEQNKVAELAKIDKERELQVAKANEEIQKANANAAKYEAQALKETGLAKVEVERAMLQAKQQNKEIYLAEVNRDVAIQQARSMENTTLDAPETVIIGSGQGTSTADLLNVKLVNDVTKGNK